jgi:hypothetical protein
LEQFRDQCDALKLQQQIRNDEVAVREIKPGVRIFKIRSVRHAATQKRNGLCLFDLKELVVLPAMATDVLIDQQKETPHRSRHFLSQVQERRPITP